MDRKQMRENSLLAASRLGFSVDAMLPLMDETSHLRSVGETIERLLCLHVAAACAYGLDRKAASRWVAQEKLEANVSPPERDFIYRGVGNPTRFQVQVESIWTLSWALGLVAQLDFAKSCDSDFVRTLPNLKIGEDSYALRKNVKPRPVEDILEKTDLAYCLHWAIRQGLILGQQPPGRVRPSVIIERRRALEWLIGSDDWDAISLDT